MTPSTPFPTVGMQEIRPVERRRSPREGERGAGPTARTGKRPQAAGEQPQSLAVTFLQKLRPGGPWVLTAIVPDGADHDHHRAHCGPGRGFHPQARRQAQSLLLRQSDANRDGQEGEEDRHRRHRVCRSADLDPADGETSEAAKARYLEQLNGTFEPRPTASRRQRQRHSGSVEAQGAHRSRRAGEWEVLARGPGEDRRRRGAQSRR